MKNKMDIAMLAPIISSMARSNENFSKMMAEVLLKAMNSNDEVEDKNVVFAVNNTLCRIFGPSSWSRMSCRLRGWSGCSAFLSWRASATKNQSSGSWLALSPWFTATWAVSSTSKMKNTNRSYSRSSKKEISSIPSQPMALSHSWNWLTNLPEC